MTSTSLLLLLAFFAPQSSKSISSGAINQQAASKDCAVNIANITGDVTVQCPGIPAKALWALNRELTARRLSEGEARRSAEEWRQKYESLQATMASAALPGALLTKALSDLDRGDLAEASKALDEAIKQQDQAVMQAASMHYYRAKVAELQFDHDIEREQLGKAYSLAPHAVIIANEYGMFLSKYGPLSESDKVFTQLLKEARTANALGLQAAILINDAGTLRFQGRFTDAMQDYLEASSLWETCFRNREPNSLSNEAAAFSGAAQVAFSQLHFEEGKDLITKSITLYRSSLKQEPSSSVQRIHLGLARALLTAADLHLATVDYDSAFSACEEAYKIGAETTDANLSNKAKGIMGDAQASECYITALKHFQRTAQNHCDRALAVLNPMQGVDGGAFDGDLAQALFFSGLVQEDQQLWSQALDNFQRAELLWDSLIKTGQSQFMVDRAKAAFYSIGAAFYSGNREVAIEDARRAVDLAGDLRSGYPDFYRRVLTEAAAVMTSLGNQAEGADIVRKRDAL